MARGAHHAAGSCCYTDERRSLLSARNKPHYPKEKAATGRSRNRNNPYPRGRRQDRRGRRDDEPPLAGLPGVTVFAVTWTWFPTLRGRAHGPGPVPSAAQGTVRLADPP